MNDSPLRRRVLPVILGCSLLFSGSCAAPAAKTGKTAGSPDADRLYSALDAAVGRYRDGLHKMLQEQSRDEGRALMSQAAADIAAGGDACIRTRGCEPQRFMAAYGNLLALRSEALAGASAESFSEVESLDRDFPALQDIPEVGRSIGMLNGVHLDQVIKVNGPIKAALQDWLTWMRPNLVDAWENYQYMRYLMWPAYEKAGLPEALMFGILAKESGGKVHAVSNSGAAGPFQFMYHTGLRFGLKSDAGFDTRYDPAEAARANVAYLNERFEELNHNLEFALAAYNGGEGRMRRIAQRSRSKSFWSSEVMAQLPRETQEYVPYVLAAAWLFLHPEDYGLEFPKIDGSPGEVDLPRAMTLNEITVCLGQSGSRDGWFRTLRNLNPRVDPNKPVAAGTAVALPASQVSVFAAQCVDGRMATLAGELQRARVPGSVAYGGGRKYVVRPGDTIASIAKRQGCSSPQALARANNISPPRYMIRPMQELKLVGCNS
jgi:membrane-bound lytic murein transglycosylase D